MGGEQGIRRLAQLGFGRDDAESDVREDKGGLLGAGFVRTAAFEAVLARRKHVVTGGQGSGKSAICRELAANGAGDVAVVLVTPGEVPREELGRTEAQGAAAGVSAELLWRYVLGVEVARHVVAHAADKHGGQVPRSVEALRRFLADNGEEASLRAHRPLSVYFETAAVSVAGSLRYHGRCGGQRARRGRATFRPRWGDGAGDPGCAGRSGVPGGASRAAGAG